MDNVILQRFGGNAHHGRGYPTPREAEARDKKTALLFAANPDH
jgi:hypothetical protein